MLPYTKYFWKFIEIKWKWFLMSEFVEIFAQFFHYAHLQEDFWRLFKRFICLCEREWGRKKEFSIMQMIVAASVGSGGILEIQLGLPHIW